MEMAMKTTNAKRSTLLKWLIDGKVYFINPAFQTKFIISVLLCVFLSLTIIFLSQQYFFHIFISKGVELGLPPEHVFFALLREQQVEMLQIFIGSSLLLSLGIGLWALFYSHRIAGPLYRLQRFFHEASKRTPSEPVRPLAFRENDFFQELPESINQFLASREQESSTTKTESPLPPLPQ
jgi:hypothetical protein